MIGQVWGGAAGLEAICTGGDGRMAEKRSSNKLKRWPNIRCRARREVWNHYWREGENCQAAECGWSAEKERRRRGGVKKKEREIMHSASQWEEEKVEEETMVAEEEEESGKLWELLSLSLYPTLSTPPPSQMAHS